MILATRQRNYLQSGLYVVIVAIVATGLLERLLTYAEVAEKSAMEMTLSRLESALYTRIALLALQGDHQALDALSTQSPFVTAHMNASNYLGEFVGVPLEIEPGHWLYDRLRHELVYVPSLTRYLHAPADGQSLPHLRFRLEVLKTSTTHYSRVSLSQVGTSSWTPPP